MNIEVVSGYDKNLTPEKFLTKIMNSTNLKALENLINTNHLKN